MINGSLKPSESTSGLLLKYLLQELGACDAQVFRLPLQAAELTNIAGSDVLVLLFHFM